MSTRNAANIQITSSLIDDYLQLEDAPVGDDLAGRFVTVQDPATPGAPSLITVAPSGELVQFVPDSGSHSGWSLVTISVPPPPGTAPQPSRLAAYSQSGVINLLAYFPADSGTGSGAVWMQCAAGAAWQQASLTHDSANALGYTFQTDTYIDQDGNQYLYGVTGNIDPNSFFLVTYLADEEAFDVIWEQPLDQFSPTLSTMATFRLMPALAPSDSFTVLWIDAGTLYYQGAQVADGNFQWAGSAPQSVALDLGQLTVAQVLALPGSAGAGSLFMIASNATLYSVLDYNGATPVVTALSGQASQPAGVLSATVGIGAGGLLVVFAVETQTQLLWVLRQTGTLPSGAPAFAPWVQLGNQTGAISAPQFMQAGAEVFTAGLDQMVYRMVQAESDMVWSRDRLAGPTPSTTAPKNVATNSMHVTVLDASQVPLGGVVLQVTADRPVTIVANELSHQIGPASAAQLPVDGTGTVMVATQATGLTPAILTFTVTNTDKSSAQRWCQGDVVELKPNETAVPPCPQSVANRLANKDPGKPITAASLSAAGLLSPNYADPSDAVSGVTSAGQWMLQNPQGAATMLQLDHVEVRHWRMTFTDPAGPRFEQLTEEQGIELLAQARARKQELGSWDSFLGDILNFFKHLWQELEEITAHIVDDVLHLIMNGIDYIVKTLRQAASALETLFHRIMQGLKDVWDAIVDVVDFIKQLFEWGDILLAHRVIKASINSLLDAAVAQMGSAETLVQQAFAALEAEVTDDFNNLEQHFESGQSFNAYADALPPTPAGGSGHALAASTVSTGYTQHGTRCNYVHSRAKSYFASQSGTLLAGTSLASLSDQQGILSRVNTHWGGGKLTAPASTLQGFVTGKITDPHDFFDLVMLDLLIACKDLVLLILDGLEDITLAVMGAASSAITGLQSGWNATIDIPVISWLYKNVITDGEDLTLLDVLSLIFAVPGTILYKIMHDGTAPFADTPEVQQIIANGLPWPALTGAGGLAARAEAADGISSSTIEVMGIMAGVAAFFGTFISMGNDGLAFTTDPLKGLPEFLSWTSVIQGVASQALGAPWSKFNTGPGSWTTADKWTVGLWGGSIGPLLYDSVFTFATGALARYTPVLGPVLDTGGGVALTAIGVATMIEQLRQGSPYTGWDAANSLVPQVGRVFKFLLLTKGTEAEPAGYALILVIDLILGIGSTVTQIGDAIEG